MSLLMGKMMLRRLFEDSLRVGAYLSPPFPLPKTSFRRTN
jgi:hypothetical protein